VRLRLARTASPRQWCCTRQTQGANRRPLCVLQVTRALSLLSDGNEVAINALKHCRVQLGARHAAERVLRLWGDDVGLTVDAAKHKVPRLCLLFPPAAATPSSADRCPAGSCDELPALNLCFPTQVELLITEYLDAGDLPEATRCLRELKMPFFHHELVKKSLVHAIEQPLHRAVRARTRPHPRAHARVALRCRDCRPLPPTVASTTPPVTSRPHLSVVVRDTTCMGGRR
jgi:hypothetical protein